MKLDKRQGYKAKPVESPHIISLQRQQRAQGRRYYYRATSRNAMAQHPFILKNAKQKLTRQLNTLNTLLQEATEFEEP
ncbi:unnamed protein product [Haemonchus placei]|uniref:Transposase n=1 Tax=Haemonchus placei TaxID=6290 RepID=A0A0N4W320_HAEPC|nr:unnamed protein product [Haemonchus placei]